MARTTKQGIEYFPLDTQFDDKIELYLLETEAIGLAVLVTLWQLIYTNEGYYISNNDDLPLLVKKRINVNINDINVCINAALKRGVFHKDVNDKHGVLTSKAIQKRYFEASKRKKYVHFNEQYLLDGITVNANGINVNSNSISVDNNATKVKEDVEVNVKEEVKEEAEEITATFPTSKNLNFSQKKIQELFQKHSRISEPNISKHINPILKILEEPYTKKLDENSIVEALQETFSKLSKNAGVRMEFLLANLRKNISAKHEEILNKKKAVELKQAERERIKARIEEREAQKEDDRKELAERPKKIKLYLNFLEKNPQNFKLKDRHDLKYELQRGSIHLAKMLIQPIMDEKELV